MNDGPIVRRISFDIHGEFITQLAREWFYTGEKSHEKVIEILMDSMTGTDTPEAQIRRYAEDILLGRAALKGSTAAGTYHLETYEPGEEEQMPQSMNIWKEVERRKKAEKDLRRMIERWDVAMDHISESTQREIRKELGEETGSSKEGGFSYTIRVEELLFRQRIRSKSTQRHRKSSCMTITWKEIAKRRRTQYGKKTSEKR